MLVVHVSGCYTYVPTSTTALQPGAAASVRINDQGRVALSSSVGPGVLAISGMLRATADTVLVMDMYSVEFLDLNVPVRMSGERVEIPRAYVQEYRERQLSRARTWLMVGLAGAGLIASFFVAVNGFGGGDVPEVPGGGPPGPD